MGKKLRNIVIAIVSVFFIFIIVGNVTNSKENTPVLSGGVIVDDRDEYLEKLKNEQSDIDGMSKYDKYAMGLDYNDNSDTDYDGLSDKEEIETYGSDPLAASTAGDLYKDGYKVEHNMDLHTYYDYEEEIQFSYNECKEEILLEADEPSDFYTVVENVTEQYSLKEYDIEKIYKGYYIYNYTGQLSVDLHELFKQHEISYSDISIWVIEGNFIIPGLSSLDECKYEKENETAVLKYDFNKKYGYYIYITEKKQLSIDSIFDVDVSDTNVNNNVGTEEAVGIIYCNPVLERFMGTSGRIQYTELSTEERTAEFKEKIIDYGNNKIIGTEAFLYDDEEVTIDTAENIRQKYEFFQKVLPMFEYDPNDPDINFWNFIFMYVPYTEKYASENVGNTITGFNIMEDELPFQNFESYIGTGGNCAGISHLTAYLYNTRTFPTSGNYEVEINGERQMVKWDLTKDEENATLSNPGLADYKNSQFVDEKSGDNDNFLGDLLTVGEKEFVDMIGCYWAEGNDHIDLNSYILTDGLGAKIDYSLIEKMIKKLDEGKILDIYMLMKNGGGHAVNIYDYKYINDDEMVFYVYDNNIPQDSRAGIELRSDACYLQVKKQIDEKGNETFIYLYYPVEGNYTYIATSAVSLMQSSALVVMDENWNVLN